MRTRRTITLTLALWLAAAIVWDARPAMAQTGIGTAAAIRNDVQGVRGSSTRALVTGSGVFSDDQVKTGDASLAQLLFLDQTTFTVASNSQAVLKDVYRPKQGLTQLVMNAVTGAFRFVSGVQTSQHYEIQFPQGYLTVRGTIVDLLVWPLRTVVILDEGAITVVPNATRARYDLDTPGTGIVVYNDGHVDGPMTWDATIMKISDTVPFPLFGKTIWPGQDRQVDADPKQDLIDILDYLNVRRNGSVSVSDARLKHDIHLLKHLDNGLNLYSYRYLWSDQVYVGVMAQEVQRIFPDAVAPISNGYLGVRYDRLGMRLMTLDQYVASAQH